MGTERRRGGIFGDVFESLIIAVILALVIRFFIFQPFYIPSGSMEPTLLTGDRIIVSKFTYYFSEPERGDVVVFKYPRDPKRAFVKRVAALGGETVTIKDDRLYIEGVEVPEEYVPAGTSCPDFGPVKVPEGKLFMLGDNRANSDDSRVWGPLDEDLLIGKATAIYWPVTRIGGVN
ncbi:MAG: signal peptidase I [Candidatus Desulforudis sp.]|nr:signal peptidase I [Desulforudis sp.]